MGETTKKRNSLPIIFIFSTLLFCAFIALLSQIDILPWFERYNEKRILQLFLLLIIISIFLCNSTSRICWLSIFERLPGLSRIFLISIVLLGVISSIGSQFPRFGILEVNLFVLLFTASICVACNHQQLGSLFEKMAALCLFFAGWLYLTGFFGYYLTALSINESLSRPDLFGNFSNIRFFNQYQSWTLSLMVLPLLLFSKRSFLITILFTATAIGWWLLLFASDCRGTMLGCAVAFPLTLLIYKGQARQWAKWQSITFSGGLISYLLFFYLIPGILETDATTLLLINFTKSNARIELWAVAGDIITSNPLLGAGPLHYAAGTNGIANHPHNSLLQVAAEWGMPVAIIAIFRGHNTV